MENNYRKKDEHRGSSEIQKDLKEAAKEYAPPFITTRENQYKLNESNHSQREKRNAFIAGAKWQKEQDEREKHRQEWIAENDRSYLKLDSYEYIIKCALDGVTRLGSLCDDDAILDASRLCAKHIKEQMMKEAVEIEVWNYSSCEDLRALPLWGIDKFNNLEDGDKVRVIVLPKEE